MALNGVVTNWSLAVAPSISQSAIFITNAIAAGLPLGSARYRAISIDSTTAGSTLTVSNLAVAGTPAGGLVGPSYNTLFLNNAGLATPLQILNNLTIYYGGTVEITNSVLQVNGSPGFIDFDDDGNVMLNTGTIITTNTDVCVGYGNDAQATVSGGMWLAADEYLGDFSGSSGTLTISGGTNTLSSGQYGLLIGYSDGAGAVWLTGGELDVSNETIVGVNRVGQMTISNGTWLTTMAAVGIHGRIFRHVDHRRWNQQRAVGSCNRGG